MALFLRRCSCHVGSNTGGAARRWSGRCVWDERAALEGVRPFPRDGVFARVGHWEPYALALSSIGGLVLSQSAFQTGSLGAALGGEQVMQPLTGVALGVGLLNEEVGTTGLLQPLAIAVALVGGVVTLAQVEQRSIATTAAPVPEP